MATLLLIGSVLASVLISGCWGEKMLFVHSDVKLNWFDANEFCHRSNKRLVTIMDEQQHKQVMDALNTCNSKCGTKLDHIWTSGADLAQPKKHVWMGNGQDMSYTNWHTNQPDNHSGKERCVEYWDRNNVLAWNDNECHQQLPVICETL